MAADIFADYLVGQLVPPTTPPPAGFQPSPVSVTPPPGIGYPVGTWFDITHVSGANFVDLKFVVPSSPDASPHGIDPICILAFRIGPIGNTQLGYKIRANPATPGTLTAQTLNSGDEIFSGHVWGDHPQTYHCLFNKPDSFTPGASQYIRFILTVEAGDHGKMRIADVVLFYRRTITPAK
jgi:hypothetical protein